MDNLTPAQKAARTRQQNREAAGAVAGTGAKVVAKAVRAFDRPTCREVRAAMQTALVVVCEQFGLTVELGGGRYDETSYTPKLTFKTRTAPTQEQEREREFRDMAHLYDLSPDDFGKRVAWAGALYTIAGIKPLATRYPILGKRVPDGKVFRLPAEIARKVQR